MGWARVDDSFYLHPKVTAAGNSAVGAWIRALAYCAAHHTGGVVPKDVAGMLATKKEQQTLTTVGMWEPIKAGEHRTVTGRKDSGRRSLEDATVTATTDGFFIDDFLQYHPTRQEVETLRNHRASAAQVRNKRAADESALVLHQTIPAHPISLSSSQSGTSVLDKLLESLTDKDQNTGQVILKMVMKHDLTDADLVCAMEAAQGPGVKSPTRVAVDALKRRAAA